MKFIFKQKKNLIKVLLKEASLFQTAKHKLRRSVISPCKIHPESKDGGERGAKGSQI